MYDKIETRKYIGRAGQEDVVKDLFQNNAIPNGSARVYQQNRDTGYPGLIEDNTFVEVYSGDEGLAKKIDELLNRIGFSQHG